MFGLFSDRLNVMEVATYGWCEPPGRLVNFELNFGYEKGNSFKNDGFEYSCRELLTLSLTKQGVKSISKR